MKINTLISWGCQLPGDPLQVEVSNNYALPVLTSIISLKKQSPSPLGLKSAKANQIQSIHFTLVNMLWLFRPSPT